MLIDPRLGRERVPQAQRSYWSRSARPGVQLIGLDSRLAEDWSGTIDAQQFGWLEGQLESHTADLIILAVHHPLHALGPHNLRGRFPKFICDNGAQVEALLDRHPNVKVVLSGHHHANHLSLANGGRRLHVCTTALSGYRCLYRTIRLTQVSGGWRAQVASHNIGDAATHQVAYQAAQQNGLAREFDPADPAAWPDFCAGRPEDLTFDAVLP